MDQKFLQIYTEELDYLRRMSGEFAREFPTVASRLDLTQFECQDPWVERLLEGVAYLTSRVRRELDGGMPHLADALTRIASPRAASPIPSSGILEIKYGQDKAGAMAIPEGTLFLSDVPEGSRTACTWRTMRPITLRPLLINEVVMSSRGSPPAGISLRDNEHSWLDLSMACSGSRKSLGDGTPVTVQLQGPPEFPGELLRCLRSSCTRIAICDDTQVLQWLAPSDLIESLDLESSVGSDMDPDTREAIMMLLMHRYATLPQQFHAIGVQGISADKLPNSPGPLRMVFVLDNSHEKTAARVRTEMFVLHAVPVLNLFSRRADRVIINSLHDSHQLIADRTRPMDYEVYEIADVVGINESGAECMGFRSIYDLRDQDSADTGFYSHRRMPRRDSEQLQRHGQRSDYRGTDSWLGLTLPSKYSKEAVAQLSVGVWCTNRDLPLLLPPHAKCIPSRELDGVGSAQFLIGPTAPRLPERDITRQWNLLTQISNGFLRVIDQPASRQDTTSLQSVLSTYIDIDDPASEQQIAAITEINGRTIVRRKMIGRRASECRGLHIDIGIREESMRSGIDVYTLPLVISRFLQRLVPVGGFLETSVVDERGKVMYSWKQKDGLDTEL